MRTVVQLIFLSKEKTLSTVAKLENLQILIQLIPFGILGYTLHKFCHLYKAARLLNMHHLDLSLSNAHAATPVVRENIVNSNKVVSSSVYLHIFMQHTYK